MSKTKIKNSRIRKHETVQIAPPYSVPKKKMVFAWFYIT